MDVSLAWMPLAVLASAAISALVLWAISRFRPSAPDPKDSQNTSRNVFLIRGNKIFDQSPEDPALNGLATWRDLRAWIGDRFVGVPQDLSELSLGSTKSFRPVAKEDGAVLTIRSTHLGQAVTLEDQTALSAIDRHVLLSNDHRTRTFQRVLESAPAVVFAIDRMGALKWGNARFTALSIEDQEAFAQAVEARSDQNELKISVEDAVAPGRRHFELSVLDGETEVVTYATDVTRLIEADTVRGEFVQTLTKTFADLSTGLAVFDRDQRLVLFNPAILDLTGLSPEFLSARPHMMELFDRLRDNYRMPEPKNYSTWRAQITDMIKSATNGHYSERWSLPGGLTYKLTGRPHPNGAIAFLIEDITDEITMTRQSRSQVDTHQAILDSMTDAIAVIGPDGGLLLSNSAFSELVGFDPDASFTPTSFKDVLSACKRRFPGNDVWDNLSEHGFANSIDLDIHDGPSSPANLRAEALPDGLIILKLSVPMSAVSLSA